MANAERRRCSYDRPDFQERNFPADMQVARWEVEYPAVCSDLRLAESADDLIDVIRTCSIRGGSARKFDHLGEWQNKWYELKYWGMIAAGIRTKDGQDSTKIKVDCGVLGDLDTKVTMVLGSERKPYRTVTAVSNLHNLLGEENFNEIFGSYVDNSDI